MQTHGAFLLVSLWALTEMGLDASELYHMSRADQVALIGQVTNKSLSDQSVGELARLVEGERLTAGQKHDRLITSKETSPISSAPDIVMPNCCDAVTPREKFINYSLDYSNKNAAGKAEAYEKGLGYTVENADDLISQIHTAVTTGRATPYQVLTTQYGVKYRYRIPVTGPNGKTKNVIAVYQIDTGNHTPRMITNYLEGK